MVVGIWKGGGEYKFIPSGVDAAWNPVHKQTPVTCSYSPNLQPYSYIPTSTLPMSHNDSSR